MSKIQFSPEIIQCLPIYLGVSIKEFSELKNFKYSRMYLYNVVTGTMVITPMLNNELNRVWKRLKLDDSDLENVYLLSELIKTGSSQLNQTIKKQQN